MAIKASEKQGAEKLQKVPWGTRQIPAKEKAPGLQAQAGSLMENPRGEGKEVACNRDLASLGTHVWLLL